MLKIETKQKQNKTKNKQANQHKNKTKHNIIFYQGEEPKPCSAETGISRTNWINLMAADALGSCVAKLLGGVSQNM